MAKREQKNPLIKGGIAANRDAKMRKTVEGDSLMIRASIEVAGIINGCMLMLLNK